MAVKMGGQVFGGKELENALKQLPKATAKSALRRALIKAAAPTETAAVAMAPRGATGNLQASIDIVTKVKPSQKKGGVRQGVDVYIGATTPPGYHAHLIEFGRAGVAARPFLRPAWDSTSRQVLESISAEIWAALAKSARTLARKAERGTLSRTARRSLSR